jgi:fluoride ion exporter CrcB/FEX
MTFLLSLVGQAWSGLADFNDKQLAHGVDPVSLGGYLTSSSFAVDVAENWQSEYLQFFLYVFATVWLVQRGSPESKPVGAPRGVTDESG